MLFLLLTSLLALPQDNAAELKKLENTWKIDKAEYDGREMPLDVAKNFKLVIKAGKYEIHSQGPKDEGTIAIDTGRKPKTMKITGTDGPNKGKTFLAIYDIADDTLRLCYDLEGKAYPTEFSAPANSKRFYAVYKPARE